MESALQFATPLPEAAELCGADGPRCGQLPAEVRRVEQGRAAGERAEQGRTAAWGLTRAAARPRARPRPRPRRGHGGAAEALAVRGVKVKPEGSPFKRLLQVVVAAFRKRKVDVPEDAGLLYHNKELDAPIAGGPPSVLRASGFGCC